MESLAFVFALIMLAVAVWITYEWGIKPVREDRKRRSEDLRAHLRELARHDHASRRTG